MLQLLRPLIFADFETTGTDTQNDRIIEYSFCKLMPDGSKEIKTGRINPTILIPEGATAVHGITNDDVKDSPLFKQKAKGLLSFIEDCDLGGFNSNSFDYPLLYAEFNRAGIEWDYSKHNLVDPGNIFKIQEARTLAAAYKFYCGKDLEGAHGAENDILATVEVFQSQLERYPDLPQTIKELALYSNYGVQRLDMGGKFVMDKDGKTILFNLGKLKGQPAKDYGFLNWMLFKADFPPDTRKIAKQLIDEIPYH